MPIWAAAIVSATMTAAADYPGLLCDLRGICRCTEFDFPILGGIFSPEHNPFHHFVGPTLLVEPPTHPLQLRSAADLVRAWRWVVWLSVT